MPLHWRTAEWLALEDVAAILGRSTAQTYRDADAGLLPVTTLISGPRRSQRVVLPADLERYLAEQPLASQPDLFEDTDDQTAEGCAANPHAAGNPHTSAASPGAGGRVSDHPSQAPGRIPDRRDPEVARRGAARVRAALRGAQTRAGGR